MAVLDPSIKEYLEQLRKLIELERQEEFRQVGEYIRQTPIHSRVQSGLTWYPLIIRETGYGIGDYPYVIVERTQHLDIDHHFQGGKQARLFSNRTESDDFINGTIHYADQHQMKIIFYADELPDWLDDGRIGVDLLFDERTYKEMDKAIQQTMHAKNNLLVKLLNICFGFDKASFDKSKEYSHPYLNASQQDAIKKVIAAEELCIIHGPPGTGKTTTLVEAIVQLSASEKNILVTAPSNAATDHITEELGKKGLCVVRVGNLSRIDDDILPYTLEYLLGTHSRSNELAEYKKRAIEMRRMAGKYKRNFGKEERVQRDLLFKEARALSTEARMLEEFMIEDVLQMADVITTTPVGIQTKHLENKTFPVVIVDEAAQALLPSLLIPLSKASKKVIMAGDPFQLPPTVKSIDAQKGGLQKTLLDVCLENVPDLFQLLSVQYRMNETIMGFSNQWFYQNQLFAHPTVAHRQLSVNGSLQPPFVFIDTAGCGLEESFHPESKSLFNEGEVKVVKQFLHALFFDVRDEDLPTVAIISPYKQQTLLLKKEIPDPKKYSINTIDSFQGQERDVVIISLVRSNEKNEIGFLQDYRRMNVAMTRAKKMLIIIGDSATIGSDPFYSKLLEYAENHATYQTAWEYLYEE